jgi:hypothetical protein
VVVSSAIALILRRFQHRQAFAVGPEVNGDVPGCQRAHDQARDRSIAHRAENGQRRQAGFGCYPGSVKDLGDERDSS